METRRFYQEQNRMVADVEWLQVWKDNPRAISEKDFDQLKKDVQGEQFKPLLITEEGIVLGGNMRLRAYKDLGIQRVWVSVVSFREDEEKKVVAYVNGKQDHRFASKYDAMVHYSIKDNETRGFYQEELLAEQLSKVALPLESYKLTMVDGINLSEILKKYSPEKDVVEDEAPEVSQEPPVSKLGEVYHLGRHRLMCGDSTKIEDVEKLMNGQKADMVFTDPPYGIEYDRHISDRKSHQEGIKNDDISNGWLINVPSNVPTYICTRWDIYSSIYGELESLGHIKNVIVWDKGSHGMGDTDTTYAPSHEFIAYLAPTREPLLSRDRDVITVTRENGLHPTMKPIELIAKLLKNHNKHNVLDLFGGSGSTLIASEQLDRTCYMMEIDPKYCDVIRKRYAKFIGKEEDWENTTPKV